ncbi:MAG: cation diffusion facilitator family transporter [Gemmatimonadota bacterium]
MRTRQDPAGRRPFAVQQRRLALATGLNAAIVVAQAVAGVAAGSLGLLADAGHNLADVAAVALALLAVRLARRAPAGSRTYGGLRWPVLAAQANAAGLLVVTALLTAEAIRRLAHPQPVAGGVVVVVALAGLAVNAVAALAVHERGADLNTRAAAAHLTSDAVVSAGVAVAGAVILATGGAYWLDPAVSLAIGVVIGAQGVRLLRQSSRVLLEQAPPGIDLDQLREQVVAVAGVTGVHDVHVWSVSDTLHAASGHLELAGHPTLEEARQISDTVKRVLAERFAITHATLESECEPCAPGGEPCEATEASAAPAPSAHRH